MAKLFFASLQFLGGRGEEERRTYSVPGGIPRGEGLFEDVYEAEEREGDGEEVGEGVGHFGDVEGELVVGLGGKG